MYFLILFDIKKVLWAKKGTMGKQRSRQPRIERYPKQLDVPREVVLAKRLERKLAHKATVAKRKDRPKVTGQTLISDGSSGIWDFKFRLNKKTKEFRDKKCIFNISHNPESDTFRIRVREPTRTYLDWIWEMIRKRVMSPELALHIFPNVKEQTEAVAIYFALNPLLPLQNTKVIVVADGSSPRGGGLMSGFAKTIVSIDPQMRTYFASRPNFLPPNLTCITATVEDWLASKDGFEFFEKENDDPVAIVAVHAHVAFDVYLTNILDRIPFSTSIVIMAIPCCIPLPLSIDTKTKYGLVLHSEEEDWGIHSPHRRVSIWTRLIKKT